jgi:dephospho-CoA kinase
MNAKHETIQDEPNSSFIVHRSSFIVPVVGLIGGMGAGKSLVAAAFARRGARVIVGDRLGHEALRDPQIKAQLVQRWGQGVLDDQGAIDRQRVAAIVFVDPVQRRALESLVFPWIERRMREEKRAAEMDPNVALIVLDAAILLEAGWNRLCDRLVYVHAPRALRLWRLAEGRGWSEKEVVARESAQMSLTDKVSRADYALDNAGAPEETARQVDALLRQWEVFPE